MDRPASGGATVRRRFLVARFAALLATANATQPVAAQSDQPSIDLVVNAGRPLRVALDERIQLKRVGQPVTGTVREPVYAYDRIVIAVGTKVRGHVARIDSGSKIVRARAYLAGNLSPTKHAVLQFDTLLLDDGGEMPIDTVVKGGIPNVTRRVAGGSKSTGLEQNALTNDATSQTRASRARSEIRRRTSEAVSEAKQKVSDTFASIKSLREPGQLHRLKDAAVQQLPYHPQYLAKGTVYDAELTSPISFGRVVPAIAAPAGTAPAPDSILTARLATTLDSSTTPRGTPFEAVITEAVFSADHRVILPEGTTLTGEVTFATPARRFHRNGRLRFLFERVQVPNQQPAPLLGALHAIDAGGDDRVAVDDEGGATLENSKTRFIAPALSLLSLHASIERDGHSFDDPDGDGSIKTAGSGAGSRAFGGFIGMGVIGSAVSQITRPVGIAIGVYGAVRTIYKNVLGKGREVTFPADTPIQVRLAPGPAAR
jgi:type IV secretory pathway VirB10-like protein